MREVTGLAQTAEDRWRAAGIIRRFRWEGQAGEVRLWDGRTAPIRPGDDLVVFFRGQPAAEFLGVERPA